MRCAAVCAGRIHVFSPLYGVIACAVRRDCMRCMRCDCMRGISVYGVYMVVCVAYMIVICVPSMSVRDDRAHGMMDCSVV